MEDKGHKKIRTAKLKPHPKAQSNFFSHLFFCWELPVILQTWKKEITEDDVYEPLEEFESRRLGDKLEEKWQEEVYFCKRPSLKRALLKLFGSEFALCGVLHLPTELAVTILQPYFLQKLLTYYTPNQGQVSHQEAYLSATIIVLLLFLYTFSFNWHYLKTTLVGLKVRTACSSLIYRQILNLKKTSLEKVTGGRLINLLSNDMNRIDGGFTFANFLWISPLQVILATYSVDVQFGHAGIAGFVALVPSILLQVFLLKTFGSLRRKATTKTDHRIRLMDDIISGIEIIKMYAWEKSYSELVEAARKSEMDQISRSNQLRLFNNTVKIYLVQLTVFFIIVATVLSGQTLTASSIYALARIYGCLQIAVGVQLPLAIITFSEALVSLQRIEEFLVHNYTKPELHDCVLKSCQHLVKKPVGISLRNVYFKWDQAYVLNNATLASKAGDLIGVMGSAGSGKSTLLQVILAEVSTEKGTVEVEGTVSYAGQEPWIFASSIKQNVLFGEAFDLDKYLKVLKVCALELDLGLFPHGDQTLVGERGVMLSGGQKARINLARAVYKDADIYLLDDPLSAVDVNVGRHIFNECVLGYLKGKCVVLVTHQVHYLKDATRVYRLESGNLDSCDVGASTDATCHENLLEIALPKHSLQTETKEHRSSGQVSSEVYKRYCAAGGYVFSGLVLSLFVLGQTILSLNDVYVSFWVNLDSGIVSVDLKIFKFVSNRLYILIVLIVLSIVVIHCSVFVLAKFCKNASNHLHNQMLHKIIYNSLSFFHHHSSGRILNRFSKDVGSIDGFLPQYLMDVINILCVASATVVIIVATNYWMIIPTVVLLGTVVTFNTMFQPTSRSTKRTEGTTRSLLFSHISATLQGLATIRSQKVQKLLTQEFDDHQNSHASVLYTYTTTFQALSFWTSFVTATYAATIIFTFFFLETSAGNVGLAVSQSIILFIMVQYIVTTWGNFEAQITSVERVLEYVELEPEADAGVLVPAGWPTTGNITFNSVSLKYSPNGTPVLKNVHFQVKSGDKIGIVGRTGAGKTSLISVLFRLFHFEGAVTIDGVDTKLVPLRLLRCGISIIPQEPVLFLGTLRKNIDHFNEFSDSEIWRVLEQLELKDMISSLSSGLDSSVLERGSNFSVGQRQLLCLVRAVLRNNKIIVLDEATANVDFETDQLIQKAIRKMFEGCTVLTIAHRLNTVMDSDKLLVMDGGLVVEFGRPQQLMKNKEGFFYTYINKHEMSVR